MPGTRPCAPRARAVRLREPGAARTMREGSTTAPTWPRDPDEARRLSTAWWRCDRPSGAASNRSAIQRTGRRARLRQRARGPAGGQGLRHPREPKSTERYAGPCTSPRSRPHEVVPACSSPSISTPRRCPCHDREHARVVAASGPRPVLADHGEVDVVLHDDGRLQRALGGCRARRRSSSRSGSGQGHHPAVVVDDGRARPRRRPGAFPVAPPRAHSAAPPRPCGRAALPVDAGRSGDDAMGQRLRRGGRPRRGAPRRTEVRCGHEPVAGIELHEGGTAAPA